MKFTCFKNHKFKVGTGRLFSNKHIKYYCIFQILRNGYNNPHVKFIMIGQEEDRRTTQHKCMQVLLVKTSACTQQKVLQDPHGKVTQEQGIRNARRNKTASSQCFSC